MNGHREEESTPLRPSLTSNVIAEANGVYHRPSAVPATSRGFNIISENTDVDHPTTDIPEVRAAIAALRKVQRLRWPDGSARKRGSDIFDWLQSVFKFQGGNVRNQREHLVLLLANKQMRLKSPQGNNELRAEAATSVCRKLTNNYLSWCKFHRIKASSLLDGDDPLFRPMELLYSALYLLIWGEAANVRFMPECLCYIFHYMAGEMNNLATNSLSALDMDVTVPPNSGPYGFLDYVIQPLYDIIKAEADINSGGSAPHYAWRNYDDMNEYFWGKQCFKEIGWPLKTTANYFTKPNAPGGKVGKTGFVEQRTFLHLFCSFHRIWVLQVLMFQALTLIAWDAEASDRTPWMQLVKSRDTVAVLLSCFITWAFLRFLLATITGFLQWRLIKLRTPMEGVRLLLKFIVAGFWTIWFAILYRVMWNVRNEAGSWSTKADTYFRIYLGSMVIFCIPEALGLLMALVPWLSRFLETSDWRIVTLLTWWFQSHTFVGRGLYESTLDTLRYSFFWIILLAGKFTFSYFLQIKPLVVPTQLMIDLEVDYRWPKFDSGRNMSAVLCLWIPTVLVYAMDVQIWYAILSSIVGLLVGLFEHIGEARNTKFLLLRFQVLPTAVNFNLAAPDTLVSKRPSWWGAIKHTWGQFQLRYYKALQPRSSKDRDALFTEQFALLWNGIVESFREEDLLSNRSSFSTIL